jgi:hypothetical protein
MLRMSKFLNLALAAVLLTQSVSLIAACAAPCRMNVKLKVRCVVADVLERFQDLQTTKGVPLLTAQVCGSLTVEGPAQALAMPKIQLLPVDIAHLLSAQVFVAAFISSPLRFQDKPYALFSPSRPVQALSPVPPQNAPPVLV